jgi:hypothetical protein
MRSLLSVAYLDHYTSSKSRRRVGGAEFVEQPCEVVMRIEFH